MKYLRDGVKMSDKNIDIKTNEVNFETVQTIANLTRKDWFAMLYEVFQAFENNEKLYDYRNELMSAIVDATNVIVAKNRYEKDDNSVV